MSGQEPAAIGAGHEAQILGVGLGGDRQTGPRGDSPHLGLGQIPQRKPHPRQRPGGERREHVGLILRGVGRHPQQRARGARALGGASVVAGRERLAPQAVGQLEHRIQTHVAVAPHARIRGLALGVTGDERLDNAGAKLLAQVDREMRQAHRVRKPAGLGHRRRRAAAALRIVLDVGPELERDGGGRARLAAQQRGHGTVDATAHRDERSSARRRPQRRPRACRGAQRSRQRIAGNLGGM